MNKGFERRTDLCFAIFMARDETAKREVERERERRRDGRYDGNRQMRSESDCKRSICVWVGTRKGILPHARDALTFKAIETTHV